MHQPPSEMGIGGMVDMPVAAGIKMLLVHL